MGRKTTIKSRILRLSILSVVVVVVVLMGVISFMLYGVYNSNYRNEAHSLAASYSQLIQTDIENLRYDLDTVSKNLDIFKGSIPRAARLEQLRDAADTSRFGRFSYAVGDGTTIDGASIDGREYFERSMEGEYYISAPLESRNGTGVTTIMSAPAMPVDGKRYLVFGELDCLYFSQGLDTIDMGEGSNIIVVDKYGQIVASSNTEQVTSMENYAESEDQELAEFAAELIQNEEGTWYYTHDGARYLSAYQDIPGTDGWTIAVSANYSEVIRSIFVDILICLAVCAGLTVLGIFISIKVANRICKPVIRNTDRLKKLSEGDVKTPFENTSPNDETYVLSESMVNTVTTMQSYITDIHSVLGAMAKGDLTVRSKVEYRGDFIEIAQAMSQITEALNEEFNAVKSNAEQLRAGAAQVASGAQLLSSNAAEETQAIAEIASTISQIHQQADKTAELSLHAASVTQAANASVQSNGELMQELYHSVENIKEKSNAISEIIKTIGDIAFQTNILALNAAIEAARAGVAGKGFAVVANEVGNLANKSQEAAQSTESLIRDSIAAVESGMALANKAADGMKTLVGDIAEVTTEITQINTAATEQKDAIDQITGNMSRIESNMQATMATAQQSASASEELSALSDSLAETVNRYKTVRQ